MPTRERVQQLVDLVEQGRFVEAIETFYAEEATTRENNDPPSVGLRTLVDKEKGFLSRIRSIRARPTDVFLVDGDHSVIHWVFDITDARGHTLQLDELAYQRWRGDKIVQERYYYDPGQIRGPAST